MPSPEKLLRNMGRKLLKLPVMIGGYGNFIPMDKSANAVQNYIYQDQTSPVSKTTLGNGYGLPP
jgi:hypothetical protein